MDCSVRQSTSVVVVVGQDSNRNLVMAVTSLIKTKDPLVAEMEAICFALQASPKSAFLTISIESDSALAISSVTGSATNYPWSLRNIKMDCDSLPSLRDHRLLLD